MTFFYDLNKKLDEIRETPSKTHGQLNERDMSRAAKGIMKYGKDGMQALRDAEAEGKPLDPVRKKYNKYDNKSVEEGMGDMIKKAGSMAKKVGGAVLDKVGHGSDADMIRDLQKKMGMPPTGKKPEQKTDEAAKWRDPKYKDKLYTQEPRDYDQYDYGDDDYYNPKPADYPGEKNLKGGGEFSHNDPLQKGQGIGRSGIKHSILDRGPRKGLPSRDQITSLKGSIKSAKGTHAQPNLPEAGAPMTAKQKSFAALAEPKDKITFADKIAGAKKEVDEMLGDVAAEAMKSALSGGQKKLDKNKNGKLDANDFAMLRKGGKQQTAEEDDNNPFTSWKKPRKDTPPRGSVEHGRKHDIKHDTTDPKYSGRIVTRRVDPSGISVGADDEAAQSGEKRGRGRPAGTGSKMGAKGPSGRSKLMTKENDFDPAEKGEYDQEGDMAKDSIKTVVRHAHALEKILGDNDNLPEWVQSKLAKIESMMTAVDDYMQNQEDDSEEMAMGEESTRKRDTHAERAGKKVTKDIEYDEKKKDGIHGKKRGSEDAKAEKAGKKVAKDIEYDEKKDSKEDKPKKVKEQGGTDTPTASSGFSYGKGIYDSMNRELEKMIAESMSVNMSDSTEGGKSLTITATDEDALKLAGLLKNAGLGGGEGMGQEMGQSEESCSSCGMSSCGCGDVHEALDENNPDWPTEPTGQEDNINYYDTDGLNGRSSTGQSTVPVLASQEDRQHTYEEDEALHRMMEMSGIQQDNLKPWERTMKEEAEEETKGMAEEEELEESFEQTLSRMRDIAGIKEDKKAKVDYDEDGKIETGAEEHAGSVDKAIKKAQAEKKVDESIFALTNQWTAYKG